MKNYINRIEDVKYYRAISSIQIEDLFERFLYLTELEVDNISMEELVEIVNNSEWFFEDIPFFFVYEREHKGYTIKTLGGLSSLDKIKIYEELNKEEINGENICKILIPNWDENISLETALGVFNFFCFCIDTDSIQKVIFDKWDFNVQVFKTKLLNSSFNNSIIKNSIEVLDSVIEDIRKYLFENKQELDSSTIESLKTINKITNGK